MMRLVVARFAIFVACSMLFITSEAGQEEKCKVRTNVTDGACHVDTELHHDKLAFDYKYERILPLDEGIKSLCPSTRFSGGKIGAGVLRLIGSFTRLVGKLVLKFTGKDLISHGWADDFTIAQYLAIGQMTMRAYYKRSKDWVDIPTETAQLEVVQVGNNYVPWWDVDGTPNFIIAERYSPKWLNDLLLHPFYMPVLTCYMASGRALPFEDALDDPIINTWNILQDSEYNNSKEWLLSFYNKLSTLDGSPSWPPQRMDFTALYRNGDHWDDGLESTMAFRSIGVHRVEGVAREFAGELLPFVIKLNDFAKFPVRPDFGKYGVDLYFTAEGMPAVLQTPDGEWIKRGDKGWQYWKFVWRSSLVGVITLCDHLYLTHFKSSNSIALATRTTLPPDHALRRFMSIFTFGAIFVNIQAQFVLVGKDSLLHRALPFSNFADLSEVVPEIIQDVADAPGMRALIDDDEFNKLPAILQEAPFYADGKLVYNAFLKLSRKFSEITGVLSGPNGSTDKHTLRFMDALSYHFEQSHYRTNLNLSKLLEEQPEVRNDFLEKRVAQYLFMVTAWHSHVGFVGDYYADPDLVGFSWKEGEAFARPRQAVITSIINIFTSTNQPRLMEDFTHLFKGLGASVTANLTSMWHDFLEDLKQVKRRIDTRNMHREVPNINMDPDVLECSVSK